MVLSYKQHLWCGLKPDCAKISMEVNYNRKKLRNLILCLVQNGGFDVGKKKLANLLYFIDFLLYEMRKRSATGLNYEKQNFGPMPKPRVFYAELEFLAASKKISVKIPTKNNFLEKITALEEPDMSVFDSQEKEVINQIIKKYSPMTAGELEKIAQAEAPYKMVLLGEEIPYHLAFYRNNFGGMDLNGEN